MANPNLINLRAAVLAYEENRYEPVSARRIAELVPRIEPEHVAALAIEAREQSEVNHASLLLLREMARHKPHRHLVAETLERVIQQPGDLCEFVALYWKDGRVPLSSQVKKGLATAFPKFEEHQLAGYDDAGPVKLRDVLFLCHAKPRDDHQAGVWKKLIWGRLPAPGAHQSADEADPDKASIGTNPHSSE